MTTRPDDPGANTHIYSVDFSAATNILAGSYDDESTSPTLEQQYIPTTTAPSRTTRPA